MKVTILAIEPLSLFELGCAVELFALPRPEFSKWYCTQVVSFTQAPLSGLCGIELACAQVTSLEPCDLLVVPNYPVSQLDIPSSLASAVLRHYQQGGRIISFCSGAFLLAELGLLDQRHATTHWRYADEFKTRFPEVTFKDDILYAYDGVIGCSAGSAAAIDLGIEVIRQDFGYAVANSVARRFVLPAHRNGGQSQFVEKPVKKTQSSLSHALEWAISNASPKLTIEDIAEKANMTRRTFDRHFIKQFNMTPLRWMQERKIENAKRLLETTNTSLEHIAELSGYESAMTMRHNFKKLLTVSPAEYRAQFKRIIS